jgi:hypothetical protein
MNMKCTQSKFPFQFDDSTFTMTEQPPGHILVSHRLLYFDIRQGNTVMKCANILLNVAMSAYSAQMTN